jgi:ATP-dependent DNA ligase
MGINNFVEVQLAYHIKKIEGYERLCKGSHIVEPKINGARGEINADGVYSRYGNKWGFDPTKIEKLVNFLKKANITIDGEFDSLYYDAKGKLLHHNTRRLKTMSIVKTKRVNNLLLDKLVFWVFDIVFPQNVFTLKERKLYLEKIVKTLDSIAPFKIKMTPYIVVNSLREFEVIFDYFVNEQGFEGVMIKKLAALYKHSRTDDWLAFKLRWTSDLPIIRIETGKKGKKNELKMGNLVVKTPIGEAEIGTGFSDAQRKWFYDNRDKVAGLVVEIEHEGYANDKGDLTNASFICERFEKPKWELSF